MVVDAFRQHPFKEKLMAEKTNGGAVSIGIVVASSRAVLLLKDPDLIQERMKAGEKENVKSWDKWIVPVIALYMPMLSWVAAGLDRRFGWSPDLPDSIQIAALAVLFAGSMFANWAMFTNRFFSSHVRIQTDRGHTVVDKGPYSVVRHPGYAGGLLSWIAAPVFFSSWWTAIPCAITIALYVYRTSLEDHTLQEELPGYREYAGRVRYRLIPGIW
jgi:protein-S-isoprenylcysteine O-methyltransferase Ste14